MRMRRHPMILGYLNAMLQNYQGTRTAETGWMGVAMFGQVRLD